MTTVLFMMLSKLPNRGNNGSQNLNLEKIQKNLIKSQNSKKSTYKSYFILKKSTCEKEKSGKCLKSLTVKTYQFLKTISLQPSIILDQTLLISNFTAMSKLNKKDKTKSIWITLTLSYKNLEMFWLNFHLNSGNF